MKIYKITEASVYIGVSINTLKTLADNGKIKSFKTTGEQSRGVTFHDPGLSIWLQQSSSAPRHRMIPVNAEVLQERGHV